MPESSPEALEETFTVLPFEPPRPKPAAMPDAVAALALVAAELRDLRGAVETLTTALRELPQAPVPGIASAPLATVPPRMVQRRLTDDEARQEIRAFFLKNRGGTLYPDQIAQALNLEIGRVADLCEALAGEGLLERD
ncbi:MAG: hypothetical protein GC191_01940 [Azospirillum sp.]|nr:hypothetical protein [Azospirillum sp.]